MYKYYKVDYIETEFGNDCIAIGTHINDCVFRLIIDKHDTEIQILHDDMYISVSTLHGLHMKSHIITNRSFNRESRFVYNRLIVSIMNHYVIQKLREKSC